MAKLTKVMRRYLEHALRNAERAHRYLNSDRIAVAVAGGPAITTLHYVRPSDGATLYPVDKQIGSDLCGLEACIVELRRILEAQS